MFSLSFQSATAWLIDNEPDWHSVDLEASIPLDSDTGLTKREARRPLGDTLRLSLRYSFILEDQSKLTAFRNALQQINTQRILCPLWMYPFAAGVSPIVTASYYVLMGDGSAPEIKTHAELPFARQAYPMMVGRFASIPDPQLYNDTTAGGTIEFIENDIWSITPPAYSPPNGLQAAGLTKPLFPWRPNWATLPKGGNAAVEVERHTIGQSRATSDSYYSQSSRRNADQAFTLQNSEPWQLLRLFLAQFASRGVFWVPSGISDLTLTADVASAATTITASGTALLASNPTILLDDLVNRVPLTLSAPTGSVYPVAPNPVGTDFIATQTRVESLVLSRFRGASISLSWQSLEVAMTSLAFIEVPTETAAPGGETLGTTMGALPVCAYLYVFSIAYPGATQTWRFTDFERDLTNGGNTYTAKPIEHGMIRERLGLDRQTVDIKSRHFADNPLSKMIPFTLEWPLKVEIYEADVTASAASNLRAMFVGEVDSAKYDGPYIDANAASLGSLFDRNIPRRLLQPTDNWALFETDNGLVAGDWEWTGTVGSYNATTGELALTGVSRVVGSAVTLDAHYFAGGYMRFGAGSSAQYRIVADSTAAVAGALTLIIGAPFTTNPVAGNTVWFYPGYDGRRETAISKFNNFMANFGGFPFIPIGNPSILNVSKPASGGGKK